MKQLPVPRHYLGIVGVLLLYFAVRLFNLTALPLFIDESIIVQWSREVQNGNPIAFGYHGKYLLPWVYSIFLPQHGDYWVLRVVTLLFVMISVAVVFRLGKYLVDERLGILVVVLMCFTPIMFFYDRLALTDTILHAMLSLLALSLFCTFDRETPRIKLGIFVSIAFILALLAKSTAIVLLPMPVVAALLLPKNWSWPNRAKVLAIVYGLLFIVWMPLYFFLRLRGINYFGLANQFSSGFERVPISSKLLQNTTVILQGLIAYFGLPLLLLGLAAYLIALYWQPRRSLTLLAMIGGFLLALCLAGKAGSIANRYWIGVVPIMLFMLMFGLYRILPPYFLFLAVGIYCLIVSFPFLWQAYTAPYQLDIPPSDRLSYIESDASGSRLPELAEFIDAADLPVLGAFPQCFSLSLYAKTRVDCFDVIADNNRVLRINKYLEQYTSPFLLILEEPGYLLAEDINYPLVPVKEFVRPGERLTIKIYRVDV